MTTTRKLAESDLFAPIPARLGTGFDCRAEVYFGPANRAIDLVADNQQVIIAFEGGLTDWAHHVEQAHQLAGVADQVWIVWPFGKRFAVADLVDEAERHTIGLLLSDGKRCHVEVSASDTRGADPSILRYWFDRAREAGVKPGSPTGSCNNAATAFLRRVEAAVAVGWVPVGKLKRLIDIAPYRTNGAAKRAVLDAIAAGTLHARTVVVDEVTYLVK